MSNLDSSIIPTIYETVLSFFLNNLNQNKPKQQNSTSYYNGSVCFCHPSDCPHVKNRKKSPEFKTDVDLLNSKLEDEKKCNLAQKSEDDIIIFKELDTKDDYISDANHSYKSVKPLVLRSDASNNEGYLTKMYPSILKNKTEIKYKQKIDTKSDLVIL